MLVPRWLPVVGVVVFLLPWARAAQESATSPTAAQQPAPNPPAATSSSARKHSHAHDFLIRGTVFTPSAMAFPGVRLHIRRTTEKKFRWDTYSDSRGEFAVRVPPGIQYEVVVAIKGFASQTRTIDAANGLSEDSVVFRMEKTGGKK